jgi:UDP-apiose/xylose synthase
MSHLCILGCGGFIGSHLLQRILSTTQHSITGIDYDQSKIAALFSYHRFDYVKMDVSNSKELIRFIDRSDCVISLAALCNPSLYTIIPIDVINSNFTYPAEIATLCSQMRKRFIHFSTCEVYGKTIISVANEQGEHSAHKYNPILWEDSTQLILGPIHAQRWSYACAKQLLERFIYAQGMQNGLEYTIIRPFNFIGPAMDYIPGLDGDGVPRVIACFMEALLKREPLRLVDGGANRRCFTFIDDAIDAVMTILENPEISRNRIFNIGNPGNETTIADLARTMVRLYCEINPDVDYLPETVNVSGKEFYGEGYEDSDRRIPDIEKAMRLLSWKPKTNLESALRMTMQWFIKKYGYGLRCCA